MKADKEGFLQPIIDEKKCVRCGKCEAVCPVINPGKPRRPLAVYAAKAKDEELRRISSSGGVFSLLARQVIADGGVVFGAAFESDTFRVIHRSARDEAQLDDLRGSKYVQSDIGETFAEVRDLLRQGIKVMYSGCPCQIAGLRNYLGELADKLLTVEVICHAAPSPMVWEKYLKAKEMQFGCSVNEVKSRRNCSWRKYNVAVNGVRDRVYLVGFGSELFSRKSCYCCPSRGFASGADITLGDFWGVEKHHPMLDDDIGISALMLNTSKGVEAFDSIRELLTCEMSTVEKVSQINKTLFGNHRINPRRARFFAELKDDNFDELVGVLTTPPLWYRVLRWVKWHTIGRPDES